METTVLGYPRIGARREPKKATEAFWAGRETADGLEQAAAALRRQTWETLRDAGSPPAAISADPDRYPQVSFRISERSASSSCASTTDAVSPGSPADGPGFPAITRPRPEARIARRLARRPRGHVVEPG